MRESHDIGIERREPAARHADAHTETPRTPTPDALSTSTPGRIELVDAIRGFALLGILLANIADFTSPVMRVPLEWLWPQTINRAALAFVDIFVTNNFFTIFSFLFGLGLSLQMMRLEARGIAFVPVYLTRQMILLFIGLAHGLLIWYGDILLPYALFGCLLLIFRRQSPKTLALIAAALVLTPVAVSVIRLGAQSAAVHQGLTLLPGTPEAARAISDAYRTIALYAHGTWTDIFFERLDELIYNYNGWFGRSYGVTVFAMFLLGLAAGRMNLFSRIDAHLGFVRRVQRLSLVVFIAAAAGTVLHRASGLSDAAELGFYEFMKIAHCFIAFFYISTLALLWQDARMRRRLRWLSAPGRMALSNYLFQSIICTSLFNSYGLGLFGSVSPAAALLGAAGLFCLQAGLSGVVLTHLRFGPVEWMWKSLTYGHRQPLRAQAAGHSD